MTIDKFFKKISDISNETVKINSLYEMISFEDADMHFAKKDNEKWGDFLVRALNEYERSL